MKNITSRRGRVRFSAVPAAAVAATLLLSSCSSSGSESAGSRDALHDKQIAATKCLRDKGYDVSDPAADADGGQFAIPDGVDPDQYLEDSLTCDEEAGINAPGADAEPQSATAEHAPQIAECMRERGFSDFPDDEDEIGDFQNDAPDPEKVGDELAECTQEYVPGAAG